MRLPEMALGRAARGARLSWAWVPAHVKQVWGGPPSGLDRSGNFLAFTATPPLPALQRGAVSAASPEHVTCEFGNDTYHLPPQVLVVCEHLFKSTRLDSVVGKGSFSCWRPPQPRTAPRSCAGAGDEWWDGRRSLVLASPDLS